MHEWGTEGEHVGAFLRTHPLVFLTEAFARDEDEIDLIGSGINGAADAFFIESERDVAGLAAAVEAGEDLRAVRHFRHSRRRNEGTGLHAFHACSFEPRDEVQLLIRSQIAGVILEAIARADLYDINTSCHGRYLEGIEGE